MTKKRQTIPELMIITGRLLIFCAIPVGLVSAFQTWPGVHPDLHWAIVTGSVMTAAVGVIGGLLLWIGEIIVRRCWIRDTLFSIVILLGALLAWISIFELRAVAEYQSKLRNIQNALAEWERLEQWEAHKMNINITRPSLAYEFGESVGGIEGLERGWFACATVGGALIIIGTTGFFIARRSSLQESPLESTLEPTTTAPL